MKNRPRLKISHRSIRRDAEQAPSFGRDDELIGMLGPQPSRRKKAKGPSRRKTKAERRRIRRRHETRPG